MHFIIEKRLTLGRLTIADATNLRREHRRDLINIASRFFFNAAAIVFHVPVETCLERNAARDRKIPRQALMNQYALLRSTLMTIDAEGFNYVHLLDENRQCNVKVRIGRHVTRRPPRQGS